MSKNNTAPVAGGCLALVGLVALWLAMISAVVWLVTTIVVSVIS